MTRCTEKQRPLNGPNALISPREDHLIASHPSRGFAADFVPCYTRMKICQQTRIISCISRELSSHSSQTSQPAVVVIPTFQTPVQLDTLPQNFLKLWHPILFTITDDNLELAVGIFSQTCIFLMAYATSHSVRKTSEQPILNQFISNHSTSLILQPFEPSSFSISCPAKRLNQWQLCLCSFICLWEPPDSDPRGILQKMPSQDSITETDFPSLSGPVWEDSAQFNQMTCSFSCPLIPSAQMMQHVWVHCGKIKLICTLTQYKFLFQTVLTWLYSPKIS